MKKVRDTESEDEPLLTTISKRMREIECGEELLRSVRRQPANTHQGGERNTVVSDHVETTTPSVSMPRGVSISHLCNPFSIPVQPTMLTSTRRPNAAQPLGEDRRKRAMKALIAEELRRGTTTSLCRYPDAVFYQQRRKMDPVRRKQTSKSGVDRLQPTRTYEMPNCEGINDFVGDGGRSCAEAVALPTRDEILTEDERAERSPEAWAALEEDNVHLRILQCQAELAELEGCTKHVRETPVNNQRRGRLSSTTDDEVTMRKDPRKKADVDSLSVTNSTQYSPLPVDKATEERRCNNGGDVNRRNVSMYGARNDVNRALVDQDVDVRRFTEQPREF
jgi:hypothetical protein